MLWLSMSAGVVFIHVFIGAPPPNQPPPAPDGLDPVALIALGAVFASVAIRWFVLPRIDSLPKKLPPFIVAAALAESCGILGALVARSHRMELFVASLLGLAQLAPLFALPRSAAANPFPRSDS